MIEQMEVHTEKDEWETGSTPSIKRIVKDCIHELLERFWVLRETDADLFYQIKDNEVELKNYFRENFVYRLITTHDFVKLEKIPVTPYEWMGEKHLGTTEVFKKQQDYGFFFYLLAFLEAQSLDRQFTLQKICEYLEDQEEGGLTWKDGIGYQNRLSLVRVLKYAVKMSLLSIDDQEIEDFAGDGNHDVLLRRTPYCSYFLRSFSTDVMEWTSLNDFIAFLKKENFEMADRKHRYYRRLFLEPIVYHRELDEKEQSYVNNYYNSIENNITRHTHFDFERYRNTSLLVKSEYAMGEKVFPMENMVTKIILLFAGRLHGDKTYLQRVENGIIRLTRLEMSNLFAELKATYGKSWTKKYREEKVETIVIGAIQEMVNWNFASIGQEQDVFIKEGLFRIVGITVPKKQEE